MTFILFNILSWAIFWTSLAVVCTQHIVRSTLFLVLTFILTGLLWILSSAEFLGLMLILVYVGAVIIFILFVIMTCQIPSISHVLSQHSWLILLSHVIIFPLLLGVFAPPMKEKIPISLEMIGTTLMQTHYMMFMLIGVLLLSSVAVVTFMLSEEES